MSQVERRDFAVEVRADDEGKLRGHAAVFDSDSLDLGGFIERIAPGAFKRSLDEAKGGRGMIHAFWSHDPAAPLGSVKSGKLSLSEDARGLAFELSPKRLTPAQLDAVTDGDMRMSFGFRTREDKWEKRDGKNVRTLLDVDLFEISLVASPAYPDTTVALRSLEQFEAEQVADWRCSEGHVRSAPVDGERLLECGCPEPAAPVSNEALEKLLALQMKA